MAHIDKQFKTPKDILKYQTVKLKKENKQLKERLKNNGTTK